MSRIGKLPITIPEGVTVEAIDGVIHVRGPKGSLEQRLVQGVKLEQEENKLQFTRVSNAYKTRAYHGLMRALVANMVHGVAKGFERKLEIVGVGYKAEVKGADLVMALGYSHPIVYPIPEGISIEMEKANIMVIRGIDKLMVGQSAAEIRAFRPPDSYKGKGIRYKGETIRLKAGKSAT